MSQVLDKLLVTIGVKGEGFDQTKRDISGFTSGIQSQFNGLKTAIAGFFTVGVAKELIKSSVDFATHFKDLAETSGETYKNVQQIERAFKNVGSSGEKAFVFLDKLAAFAEDARTSTSNDKIDLLQRWGLTKRDLDQLGAGTTTALELAKKLFSVPGADASNPLFRRDIAQISGVKSVGAIIAGMDELRNLGPMTIISEDEGRRIDKAARDVERMKDTVKAQTAKNVSEGGGMVSKLFNLLPEWAKSGLVNAAEISPLAALLDPIYKRFVPGEADLKALPLPASKRRGSGKDVAEGFAKTREDAAWSVQDAVNSAFLKVSSPDKQAEGLRAKVHDLKTKADEVRDKDPLTAAKYERQAISSATELAEMTNKQSTGGRTVDSMAAMGAFSGGSAVGSFDSGLNTQTSMLDILTQILSEEKISNGKTSPSAAQNY